MENQVNRVPAVMKRNYNQPEIQVTLFASKNLMQVTSPTEGGKTYLPFTHSTTTEQW